MEQFRRPDSLRHYHHQAAGRRDAALAGVEDKTGADGIVNAVEDAAQMGHQTDIQRLALYVRVHPDGRGVDHDFIVPEG